MFAPSLRILCLHDENSNAGELSDQLEVLGERLYEKYSIDLVYVNAPLLINDGIHESTATTTKNNPQRIWWEEKQVSGDEGNGEEMLDSWDETSSPSSSKNNMGKRTFVGLDASLLLLRQVWNSMPFWGVLAVGQGAAVASFLPLLQISAPPQFLIFVRGETLLEESELLVDRALSNRCLHLMEKTPSKSSQLLLEQFGGHVVTGMTQTFTSKILNVIGKFLIEQKKALRTSNSEAGNILVLQNHLFLAEQEAANAVAQRIALNPPKALMAVISPQNVGGWSGGKRRAPTEEGGGAPCPSEFLLRREKRTTDPHGPTREHPKQHPSESK